MGLQSEKLVSIIMPVKNAAKFLPECLNSIIAQSYSHWQLWAVDDHSIDLSYKILTHFQNRDPRINVIKNKGSGIIPALNLAIENATGFYLTRMDADDIMHTSKINALTKRMESTDRPDVAVGKVSYFSSNPLGSGYKRYARWLNKLVDFEKFREDLYRECVIPSPCWMIRIDALYRIGGFKNAQYPEDYDFCFRIFKHNLKVVGVNKVLHYWRDHEQRSSRTMEEYQDPWFLDIKIKYFMDLEIKENSSLVLWGSGKKGKIIANKLIERNHAFSWVTDNSRKIGKDIYGVTILDKSMVNWTKESRIMIAVGNLEDQNNIESFLVSRHLKKGIHYYFFS